MKVLVSGSSGLIGQAVIAFLTADGHRVTRLVRPGSARGEDRVNWNPTAGTVDLAGLEGFDAVVHLAGENVAGRWTPAKKSKILQSRVKGSRLLSETLAKLRAPPEVFVSASAIGYYGNREEELLTEESEPGTLFLSEVARRWEEATAPATQRGLRVANLRMGFVLSGAGGGLSPMLPLFKLGLGGRIGNGRQYMSWVAIDDVVGAVRHALTTDSLQGPVNVVAPSPVTNAEFTEVLGQVLRRPTLLALPEFAVRFVLGEMATNLLLVSARVQPSRLLATSYQFRFPQLEPALRHVLGKNR